MKKKRKIDREANPGAVAMLRSRVLVALLVLCALSSVLGSGADALVAAGGNQLVARLPPAATENAITL